MVILLLSSAVFSSCVVRPKPGLRPPGETRGLSPTLQFVVSESEANWLLLPVLPFKEGILVTIYFLLVGHSAKFFAYIISFDRS